MERIDPIDAYVGKRLRCARNMRGLSQGYLGSCVGVSFQQIQKYEARTNRISASKLAYFARQLGVPVYYFFQGLPSEHLGGGEPIALKTSTPIHLLDHPETAKLIDAYYSVHDRKQREAFVHILQGLGTALDSGLRKPNL